MNVSKEQLLIAYIVQTAQNCAIRTAINMGVFEKIPSCGSGISVTDLATGLEVDVHLLGEPKK